MVQPELLTLVGYWDGPETDHSWPSPTDFIDESWDLEERDFIASYLLMGLVVRTYMGYSRCRICGRENGDSELSDGRFVWPIGLSHYVSQHGVRLPTRFVEHAIRTIERLESLERDEDWWREIGRAVRR